MINITPLHPPYNFNIPHVYRYYLPITGRYYIGRHNGKIHNYKGSGTDWKKDILFYNPNNIVKEILEYVDDISKLNNREEYWLKLVDAENNPLYYNKTNKCFGPTKLTEETKQKIGNSNKGKIRTEEHIINLSKLKTIAFKISTSTPIVQYDLEGNFIREWINVNEASLFYDKRNSTTSIRECCLRINYYAFGFIWRFKGDEYPIIEYPPKTGKIILQYDKHDNFIKEWDSLTEASKYIGCTPNGISQCLREKTKHIKNFKFKYKVNENIT